jgi:hypothetical protein
MDANLEKVKGSLSSGTFESSNNDMRIQYLKIGMHWMQDCFVIASEKQIQTLKKQEMQWEKTCSDVLDIMTTQNKNNSIKELVSAAITTKEHLEAIVSGKARETTAAAKAEAEPPALMCVNVDAITEKRRKDRMASIKAKARTSAGVVSVPSISSSVQAISAEAPDLSTSKHTSAPGQKSTAVEPLVATQSVPQVKPQPSSASEQRKPAEVNEQAIVNVISPSYFSHMVGEAQVPKSWDSTKRPSRSSQAVLPGPPPHPPSAKVISAGSKGEKNAREHSNASESTLAYPAVYDNQQGPYRGGPTQTPLESYVPMSSSQVSYQGAQSYSDSAPAGRDDYKRKRDHAPRESSSYSHSDRSYPPSGYDRRVESKQQRTNDQEKDVPPVDGGGQGRGRPVPAWMSKQDGHSTSFASAFTQEHEQARGGAGRGRGGVSNLPAWMTQQDGHTDPGVQAKPAQGQVVHGQGRGAVSNLPAWMTQHQLVGVAPSPQQTSFNETNLRTQQMEESRGRGRGRGRVSNLPAWMTNQGG